MNFNHLIILLILLFPHISLADVYCGRAKFDRVMINSDRDSGVSFSNMLLIDLGDDVTDKCKDITGFAYLENTDGAYESVVYLITQAHLMGKEVGIYVEKVNKPRISSVEF